MSPVVYSVIVVSAIVLGVAAVAAFVFVAVDTQASLRLRRRVGMASTNSSEFATGSDRRLLQGLARSGKSLEKFVDKEGETPLLLAQAGWRGTSARLAFYSFQGILPLLLGGIVVVGWLGNGTYFRPPYLYAAIFTSFALSILVPRWVLRSAASRRRLKIKREVPLFVHLLVLLFEAGLSTRQALSSLVREGRGVLPELGGEFASVVRQLETGADTGETLRQLGDMLAVDDLTNILGVLRQVDRYGGEVREPLLDTLKLLEERRSLDLREQVNLISGRMTIVMVLFFFPALLIFVAGPPFLSIIRTLGSVSGAR